MSIVDNKWQSGFRIYNTLLLSVLGFLIISKYNDIEKKMEMQDDIKIQQAVQQKSIDNQSADIKWIKITVDQIRNDLYHACIEKEVPEKYDK